MKLTDKTVAEFLDALASKNPTPGGGGGAALAGALGAALASMVCNLTLGKEKYAAVQPEIQAMLARTEALRQQLTDLVAADEAAYDVLSAGYRMPKETDEQKRARSTAIQKALISATAPPMEIAAACVGVLELCGPVAEKGNVAAVSDAGVAALLAEAGLRSAGLNVLINLGTIKDEAFVAAARKQLDGLMHGKAAQKEDIVARVIARL
jgi:formiminotetrahydrofolate cyclodeaminase